MAEVLSEFYTVRDVLALLSRANGGQDRDHPSFPRLTVTTAGSADRDALVIAACDPRDGAVLGRYRVTVRREDAGEEPPGRPEVCRVGPCCDSNREPQEGIAVLIMATADGARGRWLIPYDLSRGWGAAWCRRRHGVRDRSPARSDTPGVRLKLVPGRGGDSRCLRKFGFTSVGG